MPVDPRIKAILESHKAATTPDAVKARLEARKAEEAAFVAEQEDATRRLAEEVAAQYAAERRTLRAKALKEASAPEPEASPEEVAGVALTILPKLISTTTDLFTPPFAWVEVSHTVEAFSEAVAWSIQAVKTPSLDALVLSQTIAGLVFDKYAAPLIREASPDVLDEVAVRLARYAALKGIELVYKQVVKPKKAA